MIRGMLHVGSHPPSLPSGGVRGVAEGSRRRRLTRAKAHLIASIAHNVTRPVDGPLLRSGLEVEGGHGDLGCGAPPAERLGQAAAETRTHCSNVRLRTANERST